MVAAGQSFFGDRNDVREDLSRDFTFHLENVTSIKISFRRSKDTLSCIDVFTAAFTLMNPTEGLEIDRIATKRSGQ